jgi:hypothetical protein
MSPQRTPKKSSSFSPLARETGTDEKSKLGSQACRLVDRHDRAQIVPGQQIVLQPAPLSCFDHANRVGEGPPGDHGGFDGIDLEFATFEAARLEDLDFVDHDGLGDGRRRKQQQQHEPEQRSPPGLKPPDDEASVVGKGGTRGYRRQVQSLTNELPGT